MKSTAIAGEIIVPFGALPKEHELVTAKTLVLTGADVKFIRVTSISTPDIVFLGKAWEIKCPTTGSIRTLERCLREALHQSTNIILDLQRTNLSEAKCLSYLRHHLKNFRTLKNLLIITKKRKIYKICPKNPCPTEITMLQ